MNDFGASTEVTGGTRFSEGKVVLTWLPWRGIHYVWSCIDDGMHNYLSARHRVHQWTEMLLRADFHLGRVMNLTESGWTKHAAACLYWLLQICHAHETHRGRDEHPASKEAKTVQYPALGMWAVGRVSCYGADKYAEFDWDEGQAFTTLLSSGRRHLDKALAFGPFSVDWWHGDEPEGTEYSGLLHVAHAAWNLACLLDFIEQGRQDDLDDVSPWHGVLTAEKRRILGGRDDTGKPDWQVIRDYGNCTEETNA